MLRYKTETRPGLVALYDIWPGNGAGPLLQPQSPRKYWQINQNNQKTEHVPMQSNHKQKGALINSNTLKKMYVRDKTGLVTFTTSGQQTAESARGHWM